MTFRDKQRSQSMISVFNNEFRDMSPRQGFLGLFAGLTLGLDLRF